MINVDKLNYIISNSYAKRKSRKAGVLESALRVQYCVLEQTTESIFSVNLTEYKPHHSTGF